MLGVDNMQTRPVKSTHSPNYKRFLQRLKEARKETGLTQAQVATRLGRAQSFVAKCESGERRVDIIELQRFAAVYGKTLEYFASRARGRARR